MMGSWMRSDHEPASRPLMCGARKACRSETTTPMTTSSRRAARLRRDGMAGSAGSGSDGTWIEVPSGQGIQIGDHNTQDNTFIGQYIGTQILQAQPTLVLWPVPVGDVPQRSPRVPARKALLAMLGSQRQAGPVVHVVTGMWGVGKPLVAAGLCPLAGWLAGMAGLLTGVVAGTPAGDRRDSRATVLQTAVLLRHYGRW